MQRFASGTVVAEPRDASSSRAPTVPPRNGPDEASTDYVKNDVRPTLSRLANCANPSLASRFDGPPILAIAAFKPLFATPPNAPLIALPTVAPPCCFSSAAATF